MHSHYYVSVINNRLLLIPFYKYKDIISKAKIYEKNYINFFYFSTRSAKKQIIIIIISNNFFIYLSYKLSPLPKFF